MNYLFKSALYYSLEGLLVDLMSHITWTSAYSLNIMNIEYLENCHLKQKVQDINQWSRVWTWLLSVLKNCSYLMWIVMIIKKMKRNYFNGLHIHYKHILQIHPNSNPESRQKGLTRWQTNPEKNWGPKARAKRQNQENDGSKQGKRARRRKVHCNYTCTASAVSQKHWDDLILCLKKTCIILLLWHLYLISEQRGWRTWWGRENRSCINGIINI